MRLEFRQTIDFENPNKILTLRQNKTNMDIAIINTLCEFFRTKPVDKVWVFGSFSRGEETVQSDVDILISFTPGAKFSLLDHSKWVYQLEDLLQRPVDLVKDGSLLPFAVESANHDKILVYERAA